MHGDEVRRAYSKISKFGFHITVSVHPFGVSKHVKTQTSLISSTSPPDLNPLRLFEEISYIECLLLYQRVFEVLRNSLHDNVDETVVSTCM